MQALLVCSFNPSKRNDHKGEVFKFLLKTESWIWRVKCDKYSSEVFLIRDAYLYKFKAQLDRMSYSSRHGTEN